MEASQQQLSLEQSTQRGSSFRTPSPLIRDLDYFIAGPRFLRLAGVTTSLAIFSL